MTPFRFGNSRDQLSGLEGRALSRPVFVNRDAPAGVPPLRHAVNLDQSGSAGISDATDDRCIAAGWQGREDRRFVCICRSETSRNDLGFLSVLPVIVECYD